MLYANDLVIITKSLEGMGAKYVARKNCMESKGLRVNLGETNVNVSDINQGRTFNSCCCKDVGFDSIFCDDCVLTGCMSDVVD